MDKFKKDGYLVLEGLFNEEEVNEMKNAGIQMTKTIPPKEERVVFNTTQQPHMKNKYFLNSGNKISYFLEEGAVDEQGNLIVSPEIALNKVGHYLHVLHPVFQKFVYSEKIREVCFRLGMEEPAVLQSMYIYKNPGIGSEVLPHQDETYLHTTPEDKLLGIWIALDDATLENGCLWFIPGSHKSSVHRRMIRNPDTASQELLIHTAPPSTYPKSSFVAAPVQKGSCVLINGLVVHKSDSNSSNHSRHAFTFHIADLKNAEYSKDNWLQLETSFPKLYAPPPAIENLL